MFLKGQYLSEKNKKLFSKNNPIRASAKLAVKLNSLLQWGRGTALAVDEVFKPDK